MTCEREPKGKYYCRGGGSTLHNSEIVEINVEIEDNAGF